MIELLNRRPAYNGHILTVYEDTVDVHGHVAQWDFIHHNGAAAVLPVTDSGKLLMVRQYRHALGRDTIELPAGKRDSQAEDYKICAARELEEETGYRSDNLTHLISINTTVAFCDEFIEVYLARDLEKTEQHLDPDERIDVEEWSLSDLLNKIYKGDITDSKTVSAILAYANLIK